MKQWVYLSEDEKKVLASLLNEWNSKPDKKSQDSFISSEALCKIQQLNLLKYGPEVISRDKEAKKLWEGQVQVRFPTNSLNLDLYRKCRPCIKTTSHTKTVPYSSWKERYPSGML